ncbi:MAG: carboxypeptidase M32 [Phycisphaeraceae bacterium]|nr:carboxypeptidase M32 [Phycisphaeraceae bacterium]
MATHTLAADHPYALLLAEVEQVSLLASTNQLLHFDQETRMPPAAVAHRGRQMGQLARMIHEMATSTRVGKLLAQCRADGRLQADRLAPPAVNLREIGRSFERALKIPPALAEEAATLASTASHAWAEARKANDFGRFAPWLEKTVEIALRKVEHYGVPAGGEAWDALAEDFEPGCTARDMEKVLTPLRAALLPLLAKITSCKRAFVNPLADIRVPVAKQDELLRFLAATMGFDFARGLLDRSAHPFCVSLHPTDVRMTVRLAGQDGMTGLSFGSLMHEMGHGLYSQSLPAEHGGAPMGQYVSLGIHESQSRMWECCVGHSQGFWKWFCGPLKEHFPAAGGARAEDLYAWANRVEPGLIRTAADELTYNLHIMIRFDIERALLSGRLKVADLPAYWNARYQEYLGVVVPDDAQGCLQDIHWSMGLFGYFPTYTLGNLYAAQFLETVQAAIPDLEQRFERGDFSPLLNWLREKIHRQGMRYRAAELCQEVTGRPLSHEPLLRYLQNRLGRVYGI